MTKRSKSREETRPRRAAVTANQRGYRTANIHAATHDAQGRQGPYFRHQGMGRVPNSPAEEEQSVRAYQRSTRPAPGPTHETDEQQRRALQRAHHCPHAA
jgi:hypothetical protein